MISGIGVDIESIKNFKKSYKDKNFLNLIFTKKEGKRLLNVFKDLLKIILN